MGKPLRSTWLVVTLAARADPWRALLVALMELTNGLCVATWPLWLKLLADAAVGSDVTLALVAAAGGACAVTIGLFAGWLGANGQAVLRERTGLALEERLARLSLGVARAGASRTSRTTRTRSPSSVKREAGSATPSTR